MNELKYIIVNDQSMKEIINEIVVENKKYLSVNYPELQNNNELELSQIRQALAVLSDSLIQCFSYSEIKTHSESIQRIIYAMYVLVEAYTED